MALQEKNLGFSRRDFLKKLGIAGVYSGVFFAETSTFLPIIYKSLFEQIRKGPPELRPIPYQPLLFGIAPNENNLEEVGKVSEALGQDVGMVNLFAGSEGEVPRDIREKMKQVLKEHKVPIYSWYPGTNKLADLPEANLRLGARQLRSLGGTILSRPLYEMNGTWFGWHNENTPKEVITSWQRIFRIFQEEKATNVKFVFSPNTTLGAKPIELFYPGSEYIHFISLDIYDRYSPSWLSERHTLVPDLSPEHLIGPDLVTFMTIAPDKPFLISEIGSMDRPEWVPQAIDYVKRHMPRFIGAVSFEWNKQGQGPSEIDWQMLSDVRRMNALQKVLEKYRVTNIKGPADVLIQSLS